MVQKKRYRKIYFIEKERALKQHAKRQPVATIERTQETLKMELSLKRNDYREFLYYLRNTISLI
jgi:hypothetical protein